MTRRRLFSFGADKHKSDVINSQGIIFRLFLYRDVMWTLWADAQTSFIGEKRV